jgi:hypothetical protein
MTPTARTLAHLRRLGFTAARVEVYIPAVRQHRDLFGIGDVLGVHPRDRAVLLIQATTDAHVANRLRRVQARPELPLLLAAGVAVEVWGWSLRDRRWRVRRVALRPENPAAVVVESPPRRPRRGERQKGLFDR